MTNCMTLRMSFKAHKDDSYSEWEEERERETETERGKQKGSLTKDQKDRSNEQRVSGLTHGAGPGRLSKSFWSSSWYFCVSWLQTETCCCQPKAQTLYSCWLCSKCVCMTVVTKSVCAGQCGSRLESLYSSYLLEPHWSITHYSSTGWNTLTHQPNHSHTNCLKGQHQAGQTTSVFKVQGSWTWFKF